MLDVSNLACTFLLNYEIFYLSYVSFWNLSWVPWESYGHLCWPLQLYFGWVFCRDHQSPKHFKSSLFVRRSRRLTPNFNWTFSEMSSQVSFKCLTLFRGHGYFFSSFSRKQCGRSELCSESGLCSNPAPAQTCWVTFGVFLNLSQAKWR